MWVEAKMQAQKEAKLNRVLLYYTMIELLEAKLHPPQQIIQYGGGLSKRFADDNYVNVIGDTMTGDLDLGGNDLLNALSVLFTNNLEIVPDATAGFLRLQNIVGDLKYMKFGLVNTGTMVVSGSSANIRGPSNVAYDLEFFGSDGDPDVRVARIVNDATLPWFEIPLAGDITLLDQKMMTLGTYTDAQRPAAGTAGRWIFNTDDGMPNYDDGTDWRDINGNIT